MAIDKLGFKVEEKYVIEDPLGLTLIVVAGLGVLFLGFKFVFLKKRVKVLK